MTNVTATATNPATGATVQVTFKSWASQLITQYLTAVDAIETAHGFRPDVNSISIAVR